MLRRTVRVSVALTGAVVLSVVLLTGCGGGGPELSKDYKALNPNFRLDQSNQTVVCMKDKGFTVLPDSQGGVSYGNEQVPDDQVELANKAIFECSDELGFDGAPEPADAQLRKLYALNLEAAKCLEGLDIFGEDITLKVTEPPSEQSFVESFNAVKDGAPWSPWGLDTMKQLSSIDEKIVDEARLACPDPLNYVSTL